jgi:hypothetical protein
VGPSDNALGPLGDGASRRRRPRCRAKRFRHPSLCHFVCRPVSRSPQPRQRLGRYSIVGSSGVGSLGSRSGFDSLPIRRRPVAVTWWCWRRPRVQGWQRSPSGLVRASWGRCGSGSCRSSRGSFARRPCRLRVRRGCRGGAGSCGRACRGRSTPAMPAFRGRARWGPIRQWMSRRPRSSGWGWAMVWKCQGRTWSG